MNFKDKISSEFWVKHKSFFENEFSTALGNIALYGILGGFAASVVTSTTLILFGFGAESILTGIGVQTIFLGYNIHKETITLSKAYENFQDYSDHLKETYDEQNNKNHLSNSSLEPDIDNEIAIEIIKEDSESHNKINQDHL